jgi:3-polyprenyl-4-hydroxybenzoate decarboxylase
MMRFMVFLLWEHPTDHIYTNFTTMANMGGRILPDRPNSYHFALTISRVAEGISEK